MLTESPKANVGNTDRKGPPIRIGDLLLGRGMLTQEQLDQALGHQRERGHKKLLGEILVELGFTTEEQVTEVLAQAYGVPFARINARLADPKVLDALPREFLDKHNVLPLFMIRGKLTVAVPEPANVFLIEELERVAGVPVQIVAATTKDIRQTLAANMPEAQVFELDDIVDGSDAGDLTLVEKQVTDINSLEAAAGDSPVVKLVNHVISSAVHEGASDIHIEPGDKTLRIRLRIDGVLFEKLRPPHALHPAVTSRIKIMAGLDISERRMPQDGAITVMLHKRPVDLRVSTMPGKFGEKVVIRVIDNRNIATSLDRIGFSPKMLERFRGVLHQPNGIVLVTGPTGSGKSTTLYGALAEINDDTVNISTVEDPVEYNLAGVNQFQVNERAGFTFAGALRSLLRQDPDIVMLGEIRDQETAKIATQAALTGHLVLSTLHTNDAPSAVTRLYNIGVEPYLVAAAIRGVLAQRLLRRICNHCKEPQEITPAMRIAIDQMSGGKVEVKQVHHGVGCNKCRGTGYSGRLGIFELFIPDDEMLDAISRGAGLHELRKLAAATGYTTLREDGIEKAAAGLTSFDEVLQAASLT